MKYGYESPDSFSRAFQNVHGIMPYIVRNSGISLKVNGPVNIAMADAWKRIFSEWLPTSSYKYAETIDVECFPY
jgi:AraC family transcriptional regulator